MNPEQFCYWLQGVLELRDTNNLSEEIVKGIRDHLETVFQKETADYVVRNPCSDGDLVC